jgi:alanine racemase
MTSPALAPAVLTISLKAVAENYRLLAEMTNAAVAGVIKADGYGCGAAEIFETLLHEGCRHLFVATPDEAIALRALDDRPQIMVLGGLYEDAEDFYVGRGIIPVLNSMGEAARWAETARRLNMKLPAVLHYDTGMNRLGFGPDDLPNIEAFDLRLIMSHFAASDEKNHPMNAAQNAAFTRVAAAFPNVAKSLSNSSGIFRSKSYHHDLVRPGYALYGGNPVPEMENPMRRVVSLKVRILQTRIAHQGESAGYNATHVFKKDTRLATVALGYADGFLRGGSNRAKLYWRNIPCPIVGRVSMDSIIVDIGHLAENPQAGEWMEVLGPHQSVDDLARDCGTIGYEILTSLGARYHRVYER